MKAGTTLRCDCGSCETEFEVTLEPKAKDSPSQAKQLPDNTVANCPFCGSSEVTTDED